MYPLYWTTGKGGTYQNECFLLFLCMTYEYRDYALSVLLTKGKVLISMEKVALYMVKWNDDVMKEKLL